MAKREKFNTKWAKIVTPPVTPDRYIEMSDWVEINCRAAVVNGCNLPMPEYAARFTGHRMQRPPKSYSLWFVDNTDATLFALVWC